mmetsp:Transcript_28313/g.92436  ORF Transcript_28313/g.92436 Transcript_28313/m.92436 type:complete len:358 (+) Transcript_28313:975-2048(+)
MREPVVHVRGGDAHWSSRRRAPPAHSLQRQRRLPSRQRHADHRRSTPNAPNLDSPPRLVPRPGAGALPLVCDPLAGRRRVHFRRFDDVVRVRAVHRRLHSLHRPPAHALAQSVDGAGAAVVVGGGQRREARVVAARGVCLLLFARRRLRCCCCRCRSSSCRSRSSRSSARPRHARSPNIRPISPRTRKREKVLLAQRWHALLAEDASEDAVVVTPALLELVDEQRAVLERAPLRRVLEQAPQLLLPILQPRVAHEHERVDVADVRWRVASATRPRVRRIQTTQQRRFLLARALSRRFSRQITNLRLRAERYERRGGRPRLLHALFGWRYHVPRCSAGPRPHHLSCFPPAPAPTRRFT